MRSKSVSWIVSRLKAAKMIFRLSLKRGPLSESPAVFPCGMSRSGTTLVATILDSHPRISMGYELIPPPVASPAVLLQALDQGLDMSGGDFRKCGGALRKAGRRQIGLFLARCQRTGIAVDELRYLFQSLDDEGLRCIMLIRDRLALAWRVVERKRIRERTNLCGFKVGPPIVVKVAKCFPNSYFICIVRDPRDVVASYIERKFGLSPEEICANWNKHLDAVRRFHKKHSSTSLILRYEDLVCSPQQTLERVFAVLPVHMEESVFRFYKSKASVHESRHPNAANLKRDFFTSSIGRWMNELPEELGERIHRLCARGMESLGYA